MKFKDFNEAATLVNEHRRLTHAMEIVAAPGGLGVTIQGKYQDEALLVDVRPVVLRFLENQQQIIIEKLIVLGIYDFEV